MYSQSVCLFIFSISVSLSLLKIMSLSIKVRKIYSAFAIKLLLLAKFEANSKLAKTFNKHKDIHISIRAINFQVSPSAYHLASIRRSSIQCSGQNRNQVPITNYFSHHFYWCQYDSFASSLLHTIYFRYKSLKSNNNNKIIDWRVAINR